MPIPDTLETPGTSSEQPLMDVKPEPAEETVDHQQHPSEEITLGSAVTQGEHDTQEVFGPTQDTAMLQQAIDTQAGGSDSSDLAALD